MLLAYFSAAAPSQSFDEALANSDAVSETAAQPDTDFLGQQLPSIPGSTVISRANDQVEKPYNDLPDNDFAG